MGQVFSARAGARGAVVRRAVPWGETEIGRETFLAKVRRRGRTLPEAGSQFVAICNRKPVRQIL